MAYFMNYLEMMGVIGKSVDKKFPDTKILEVTYREKDRPTSTDCLLRVTVDAGVFYSRVAINEPEVKELAKKDLLSHVCAEIAGYGL